MILILMRHAKSSWGDPMQEDHERPLNKRGREAAPRMGAWLRAQGFTPARILCSDAVRTRQTCAALGFDVPPELRPDLYLAGPGTILTLARAATESPLLVIGHNPGIAEAAEAAVDAPPAHPDWDRYPTGATAVIDTQARRVLAFAVPRDMAED
ncbi:SixA phosphatase family protein [Jannaschia seohaensis]|uniref:Phosphohistidine phosphatase n=1 Tax=Jannaschia seohaensis TaxID=475081 RepID=A0A2Y9B4S2_9RHOB|nr:histidine phosphatase family protein [Jannaschia seohaensis]PWJ10915.1 phosphohistidine phosphatase [Jannaschia seohaensis]SSA51516.1 phosphohistidine phosphatase [Jannaschia seohaensis]